MRYLYLSLLFATFLPNHSVCQKHDYIWLGGNTIFTENRNFLIDFNNFPPKISPTNSSFFGPVARLSLANNLGNLSFFSNGCWIKNKDSKFLTNGNTLNSGDIVYNTYCLGSQYYPVSQGIFALPFGSDRYMLIHIRYYYPDATEKCSYRQLFASKIDMAENGGQGKVVFKDSLLLTACLQKAAATRHANGRDWWVLASSNKVDTFYRFLITPDGIKGPWSQQIKNPTIDDMFFPGWISFSSDGQTLAVTHDRNGTALYHFDRCTGFLSNLRFIIKPDAGWVTSGNAFSPDNRYFYLSGDSAQTIIQYDLASQNVNNSGILVAVWDGYKDWLNRSSIMAQMQQGPDGKIYIRAGDTRSMHIVHFPNRKGSRSLMKQRAFSILSDSEPWGIYYPNYRLGPFDRSPCDTLGLDNRPTALFRHDLEDTLQPLRLTFTDLSYYEPAEWRWDFGDPGSGAANMSQDTNPVHAFSKPGLYTVCLIVKNEYAADTFCRQVSVGLVDAVENLPLLPRVAVSPNPFSDAFRVSMPALVPGARARFALYDALGQRVRDLALTDFETEVATGGLPAGLYYWTFSLRGQAVQSGRAVLLR